MNRSELIQDIAEQFPILSSKDAEMSVKTIIQAMCLALVADARVEIRDFGSFSTREHDARSARNPRTGEQVVVPKHRSLLFKAGKALRERIKPQGANESSST